MIGKMNFSKFAISILNVGIFGTRAWLFKWVKVTQ